MVGLMVNHGGSYGGSQGEQLTLQIVQNMMASVEGWLAVLLVVAESLIANDSPQSSSLTRASPRTEIDCTACPGTGGETSNMIETSVVWCGVVSALCPAQSYRLPQWRPAKLNLHEIADWNLNTYYVSTSSLQPLQPQSQHHEENNSLCWCDVLIKHRFRHYINSQSRQ